ncbi:MAG TPA: FAD-dependent monooxygenase [Longimicrobiaceae bacterium]|nr:FAD-dependent monooxygenase [Longimicrobiaceae bacterium]
MTGRVVIVGGGIGGLTLAIALRQKGIEVRVYEAAPELRAAGAGIWVPPNAMQVLDRLGMAGAVLDRGERLERAEIRDCRGGVLQAADVGAAARRFGFPTVAIHRGRLQRVLLDHLPADLVHVGRECTGIESAGGPASACFADGSVQEGAVVVGADGAHSRVREALFPGTALRYSGQSSYRAVVPHRLPDAFAATGWEVWGPGRRFGFSAVGGGEVYWYATLDAPAGERDAGPDVTRRRLDALAAGFPAPVPELVAATDPARTLRTDMYDLPRLRSWHRGRVVLLGDAAHATTPNLGQGGAQAMEDAWVLAEQLASRPDPEAAFAAYQRIREPKARMVVDRSRVLGRIAHLRNPLARGLRNSLLRLTPASVALRQMEALYTLDY